MSASRPWYAAWFDDAYLELYAHRDSAEAERATANLLAPLGLSGRRVLDVGCGAGRFVRAVAERGARVVGLDLSASLLAAARASGRAQPLGLVRGDMRCLPFRSGCFDLVLSMFTSFGYFPTPQEDESVLAEMARVLSRGGDVVIDFLNATRVRHETPGTVEREAGPYHVREIRYLDAGGTRAVKEIELRRGSEVRRIREEVRLWGASELVAALASAGLRLVSMWGDYEARPFEPETSPRLVVHARR